MHVHILPSITYHTQVSLLHFKEADILKICRSAFSLLILENAVTFFKGNTSFGKQPSAPSSFPNFSLLSICKPCRVWLEPFWGVFNRTGALFSSVGCYDCIPKEVCSVWETIYNSGLSCPLTWEVIGGNDLSKLTSQLFLNDLEIQRK